MDEFPGIILVAAGGPGPLKTEIGILTFSADMPGSLLLSQAPSASLAKGRQVRRNSLKASLADYAIASIRLYFLPA